MTNLVNFLEVVYEGIDEGIPEDIIYLDVAKAFDKVTYKRLVKKLQALEGRY